MAPSETVMLDKRSEELADTVLVLLGAEDRADAKTKAKIRNRIYDTLQQTADDARRGTYTTQSSSDENEDVQEGEDE